MACFRARLKDLDWFVYDGHKGRVYDLLNRKYTQDNWYKL